MSCMVALPTQLFRSTGIPVCLWFFAKDKTAGKQGSIDRTGQVLFIDAREPRLHGRPCRARPVRRGHREDRRHVPRLARDGVGGGAGRVRRRAGLLLVGHARGDQGRGLRPDAGPVRRRCRVEDDGEPIDEKIERLSKELFAQFEESDRLAAVVREQLGRVSVTTPTPMP